METCLQSEIRITKVDKEVFPTHEFRLQQRLTDLELTILNTHTFDQPFKATLCAINHRQRFKFDRLKEKVFRSRAI